MNEISVLNISLPQYQIDSEPDHKTLGKVVDAELKKHLMGQTVLIRALGSMEHYGKSPDELIEIIKTTGTDRYDPDRQGDRYSNVQGKHIDLYALKRTISPRSNIFW